MIPRPIEKLKDIKYSDRKRQKMIERPSEKLIDK